MKSRILRRLIREHKKIVNNVLDSVRGTYTTRVAGLTLDSYFDSVSVEELELYIEDIRLVSSKIMKHEFDLLGSGWISVNKEINAATIENTINRSNRAYSSYLSNQIEPSYSRIEWHSDHLSKHKWSQRAHSRSIKIRHSLGVDVKWPWELSRMQHLPYLVWAYVIADKYPHKFLRKQEYVKEFENEILDFISSNPPRFGVNWICAMDCAIRVINWLVSYDLFKSSGWSFREEFSEVLLRSVVDHRQHIIDNLEWKKNKRNNHYLADLVGLLFCDAYIKSNDYYNHFISIAKEIMDEVIVQFDEFGICYEGSTAYHCLSTEFLIYSLALMRSLSEKSGFEKESSKPLLPRYISLLENTLSKSRKFIKSIMRQDGTIPQIGDNDNGRLLKPKLVKTTFRYNQETENHLDKNYIIDLIDGILESREEQHGILPFHSMFIKKLYNPNNLNTSCERSYENVEVKDESRAYKMYRKPSLKGFQLLGKREIIIPIPHMEVSRVVSHPSFGLYIIRTKNIYLGIRCGGINVDAPMGHFHDDQLSIILQVDSHNVIDDPGTYQYTRSLEGRNKYRSARSHFTVTVNGSEHSDLANVFGDRNVPIAFCTIFSEKLFFGWMKLKDDLVVTRYIRWDNCKLKILDSVFANSFKKIVIDSLLLKQSIPVANGYGDFFDYQNVILPETSSEQIYNITYNGVSI